MKISVIVPAFNEAKLIAATLRSIRAATAAFAALDWDSELIVCDNNSTDGTADLARAEGATVVFEPVNQIARARNRGAAAATGQWLLFIDADSRASRELFAAVAEQIQSGGCVGGGSTIKLDEPHFWLNLFTAGWNLVSRLTKWAAGSLVFCEAAAFREVGGFNLALFAGEELDLSRRLKKLARRRGWRFVILRQAPLVTSARKARLYTFGELLPVFLRAVFTPKRFMQDRSQCGMWYDGRR